MTVSFDVDPPDPRALELVNKTNQFNLNGRRWSEGEWRAHLQEPDIFLLIVAYQDRYGPLGKIAVLAGQRRECGLCLDTWVMSCRAFARRIEHRCLQLLFGLTHAGEIEFAFEETPRNGPLRDFLESLLGGSPAFGCRLSRAAFEAKCPPLHQEVRGLPDG
jgi:FkbH-like protein